MNSAFDLTRSSMQSKPQEKWLFTEEQLKNTPSHRENVSRGKEFEYRWQASNLIQEMGNQLSVHQLTINTAIVYMQRFYMVHSFPRFSRFVVAPTALFIATKVENLPKTLEDIIQACHSCLYRDQPPLDLHSDVYSKQFEGILEYEKIMTTTFDFRLSIDHPHKHVVKYMELAKASRDHVKIAYFMATTSLHHTTFCLQYKPTVVAAMCIHASCKWLHNEIPLSSEGKPYWYYMDRALSEDMLDNITTRFLHIVTHSPAILRKLKDFQALSTRDGTGRSIPQSKDSHAKVEANKAGHSSHMPSTRMPSSSTSSSSRPIKTKYSEKRSHNSEDQKRSDRLISEAKVDHSTGKPGLQRQKHPKSVHHYARHAKDRSHHRSKHTSAFDGKSPTTPHNQVPVQRSKGNDNADSNKISTSHHAAESGANIVEGMEQPVLAQMNSPRTTEVAQANASSQSALTKRYKQLYDISKRTPNLLRFSLEKKGLAYPLYHDEKRILLQLKEDENRQRRKLEFAKQRDSKSQPGHNVSQSGQPDHIVTTDGSLSVDIELPPWENTAAFKGCTASIGQQVTSNLGSDVVQSSCPVTCTTKSGNKRSHDVPIVSAPAAKRPKKSHRQSRGNIRKKIKKLQHNSYGQARRICVGLTASP